ncbi:hypothetical protein [Chitinilyticum aquatile]|uniref:hypothetical protein n=1 Tax=Chitinilyticum aquatile TaxID=362520 RepID=UPI0003FE3A88|nr:hypothetical protein [Chitinilyticum aquatile]
MLLDAEAEAFNEGKHGLVAREHFTFDDGEAHVARSELTINRGRQAAGDALMFTSEPLLTPGDRVNAEELVFDLA